MAEMLFSTDEGITSLVKINECMDVIKHDGRFVWRPLPDGDGKKILIRPQQSNKNQKDVDSQQESKFLWIECDTLPQFVWPAAEKLCEWVVAHKHLFEGRTVLELGAGTGMVGFTLSKYASTVVLTDLSPISIAMMTITAKEGGYDNCYPALLKWGDAEELRRLKMSLKIESFDIVIGSEIFYLGLALRAGLETARQALHPSGTGVFYCGSFVRSDRMETDLLEIPAEFNFDLDSVLEDDPFHLYTWVLNGKLV